LGKFAKALKDYELALYPLVAQVLTGRKCKVEFRRPYVTGVRGIAAREGDTGVIHIKPGMEPEQTLKTFLHEVAHIRLDWHKLLNNEEHLQEADTVDRADIPASKMIPQVRQMKADSMAAYWLHYAEMNTRHDLPVAKLTALLNWREIK
jgi:hypothetical protein